MRVVITPGRHQISRSPRLTSTKKILLATVRVSPLDSLSLFNSRTLKFGSLWNRLAAFCFPWFASTRIQGIPFASIRDQRCRPKNDAAGLRERIDVGGCVRQKVSAEGVRVNACHGQSGLKARCQHRSSGLRFDYPYRKTTSSPQFSEGYIRTPTQRCIEWLPRMTPSGHISDRSFSE